MALKHLEIYNFGPIREVKLDFTRVNVFIGPQSVGKSCILKIACHCAWVEKRLMVSRDVTFFKTGNYFFEQLIAFHKLQGYDTNPNLRIVYKTSFLTLEYIHSQKSFTCKFTSQGRFYKRAKLSYIPAERNVIATIPNWMELSYEDTNTRSFMADWAESRKEFARKQLKILSLGAEYYYDEINDRDMVKLDGIDKKLPMSNASSGLQSLIPIMLYVHYLTQSVFKDKTVSVTRGRDNEKLMHRLYKELTDKIKLDKSNFEKSYDLKLNSEFLSFSSAGPKDAGFASRLCSSCAAGNSAGAVCRTASVCCASCRTASSCCASRRTVSSCCAGCAAGCPDVFCPFADNTETGVTGPAFSAALPSLSYSCDCCGCSKCFSDKSFNISSNSFSVGIFPFVCSNSSNFRFNSSVDISPLFL